MAIKKYFLIFFTIIINVSALIIFYLINIIEYRIKESYDYVIIGYGWPMAFKSKRFSGAWDMWPGYVPHYDWHFIALIVDLISLFGILFFISYLCKYWENKINERHRLSIMDATR